MNITVTQKSGDTYNNEILQSAVEFFAKKLLKKKYREGIRRIRLTLVKAYASAGECYDYKTVDGMFNFNIKIDKEVPFPDLLVTIAHEMVHVAQIADGRLTQGKLFFWKGRPYYDPYTYLTDLQQQELPWEREAYDNERKLAKEFINHYYATTYIDSDK